MPNVKVQSGSPTYYRHEIYQGTDYSATLTLFDVNGAPINLSGAAATSAIATLEGVTVAEFTATVNVEGRIEIRYSADQDAIAPGRYLHDLIVNFDGETRAFISGDVLVYKRITALQLPPAPDGFIYLTGPDGFYLLGPDGFYLLGIDNG